MLKKSHAFLALASLVAAAGVSAGRAKANEIKMGYINKMGEHPCSSPKWPAPRPRPASSASN